MEHQASHISLKDFLLLHPKEKGEFLIDQTFSFDDSSLHTNDTLSNSEDSWSLASLSLKKSPKSNKRDINIDQKPITLKEMVIKRQRNQPGKKKDLTNDGNLMNKSKKISKKDDDKNVTSASFAKRQHTQKWNLEETKKFYKGLELFGTDFSMIAKLFGARNRLQIKNKFRKEEKTNLKYVDECLKMHSGNKYSFLVGKIRKNSYTSIDSLDKRMIEEIEEFKTEMKNFKCPEPKRKPVKILRSLTFDNRAPALPPTIPKNKPTIDNDFLLSKEKEFELLNSYQNQLNHYSLYGYTFTMDHYLRRLIQTSYHYTQQIQEKYDLLLLMKGMLKTFMMNELELIFLSYFLEENKWNYVSCISPAKSLSNLPENFQNIDVEKPIEYKALIVYLFYSCFAIKQIFHEQNEVIIFGAFLNKMFEDFFTEFTNWRNTNQEFLVFEPLILNKVFENNSLSWKGMQLCLEHAQSLDTMVNSILEMSPPYLYEKNEPIIKKYDFDSPVTLDLKSEFKEEIEKRELPRSNTKDIFGFENFHREDSFKRLGSLGFSRFLPDDYMRMESNFSLPRADSFRSNTGFNSNTGFFFNVMNNNNNVNNINDVLDKSSSQETNQNKAP